VLGVTYEDASPDAEAFVRHYHLTNPNLRGTESGDFARAFGTDRLPESFIIDRRGRVVALERNEVAQKFIDRAIRLAETS
jgi:cytochrome c biogenesis protein CcmG/thiol:disulfide interchange protein DsbE